ncbi:MAG TPA: PQQ-binding-like beta-propeller repeat protein [Gemmataceae bacterium]|nr:PQQ-binding-like beta-propeller repeat protein [Gemmataceae bacterium]
MKPSPLCRRWLLGLGALLAAAAAAPADNWPQWRGPTNDGICKETKLPAEWAADKNIAWKLPLPGMGGSTPVVWGDRIFLTSADGKDLVLICASTAGKALWKRKLGTGTKLFFRGEGNMASASPSTDGRHVWAFVGSGDFACFDLDGKEVWRFNAEERYGKFDIQHGMHVTPLLDGDRLYLSLLHGGGQWLLALDKATGKEVWKVGRKTDGRGEGEHSYASPCLWRKGRDAYLVVHGCDYATAHRLSDGAEIWRLGDLNPKERYNATLRFVASPVASPDLIVVPTAKNGPVVGVRPTAKGAITAGSAGEQWRRPRGTPDVPSPLIHDGLVYLCGESGTLTCLDAKTGKEHYSERLHSARYRASPVLADGKLYLTARDGVFTVVRTGPRFEKLAENRLPDSFTSSPAVSNGRIYLRGFKALYAVQEGGR